MIRYWLQVLLHLSDDVPFYAHDQELAPAAAVRWRVAAMALIVLASFGPALRGTLLWGDDSVLTRNPAAESFRRLTVNWLHPLGGSGSPVANTLWYLQRPLWGLNVDGYRAVNLAIHVANALLVWLLLRRLAVAGAWLGACCFALHPAAVEPVAWLSQSGALVAGLLSLASVLLLFRCLGLAPPRPADDGPVLGDSYADAAEPARYPRVGLFALSVVLYALAALSRPAAAAVPLVALVLLWWRRGRLLRTDGLALAPYFLIGAAATVTRLWVAASHAPLPSHGRYFTALPVAFLLGAGKVLWPFGLRFLYPSRWSVGPLYVVPIVALACAAALPRARRGGTLAATLCFAVLVLAELLGAAGAPVPQARAGDELRHDALDYLAVAPLAALFAAGITHLLGRAPRPGAVAGLRWTAGVVVLGTLAALTARRGAAYATSEALWQDALAADRSNVFARCRLADRYRELGQVRLAADQLSDVGADAVSNAVNNAVDDPDAWLDFAVTRGRIFEAQARPDAAMTAYREGLARLPGEKTLTVRLGELYRSGGRTDDALALYEAALRAAPADATLHNNYGLLLFYAGRPDAAAQQARAAVDLEPGSVSGHLNLANVLFALGRLHEAAEQLHEVIKLDPTNFEAFMNAGAMLGQLKEFEKSEKMLRAAVQLRPESAEARNNLGIALAAQGKLSEAVYNFARAVAIRPRFEDARRNLDAAKRDLAAKARSDLRP